MNKIEVLWQNCTQLGLNSFFKAMTDLYNLRYTIKSRLYVAPPLWLCIFLTNCSNANPYYKLHPLFSDPIFSVILKLKVEFKHVTLENRL